ncbi:2-keto-4-pentenoate hydratase [Georgenia yuyongxinii]|uniref:2-keto-4-pentenoate hydratase n=1 Tax=Georgenia yuyongxinii TaxID=2589797 RepID=UPI00163D8860|nr:fumarylacetoacetate hydrolase family protein [Georgenia yuyongxinii]
MTVSTWTLERVVDELLAAETERRDRGPITDEFPGLDIDLAYRAQDALLQRKLDAGERLIGVKLGLTSRAKQQRMGIDAPLTAWLTDAMALPAGVPAPLDELIHPRVEPEIVFVLGEDLKGPGITAARAMQSVEAVYGGYEIIDSRYTDFRFTLPDVIADNASAGRYGVGPVALAPRDLDLPVEACLVEVDGEIVDTATAAAVQGHPAEALALAANALAARGHGLKAGWTVLTGGITDAVFLHPGSTVSVHFSHLGTVTVTGA